MKFQKMVNRAITALCLYALLMVGLLLSPATGSFNAVAQKTEGAAIIYDNGGLATGSTSNSGVLAPGGAQWSEAPNPYGNTQQSNTSAGVSCSVTATVFRCADDFNVPVGQTWTVSQIIVFAYQTGFAGGTSPITAATLRIWNGRPGDPTSTIVFGDTTTNRLASSTNSSFFRIFSSVVGAGANPPTAPGTTRIIWQTGLSVAPAAVLPAGNYWIDWNTAIGTAAHFSPSISYQGVRGIPGQNSRQNTGAAWVDIVDPGQAPTGAPAPSGFAQDFPFKVVGSVAGAPAVAASRAGDYDGDNRTDLAVARAANATAQSTWLISNSTGGTTGTAWGVGLGFAGADVATPSDFDGDGKTDIAVWRSNPAGDGKAVFYILQSQTNTVRADQFGKPGDEPTVVGDYDADGKSDLAVFRTNVAGFDPCGGAAAWYYRRSTVPAENFSYACWGTTGDKPYPGDFDGDRKYDFSVIRNNGGNALHFQKRTTAGDRVLTYGLFTDKFVTGDFDADGRADLVAVRSASGYDWFMTFSGSGQLFQFTLGSPTTDFIVPGDYDGDKKTDFALWRSGLAVGQPTFMLTRSASSPTLTAWGGSAVPLTAPDYPVATSVNVH